MSSYFDERESAVNQDFSRIEEIEEEVKRDVLLVAGDRETPEVIRQDLMRIVSLCEYTSDLYKENPDLPKTTGRIDSDICRSSSLLSELHRYFHSIASQRIETRFGRLSDNPGVILKQRDYWLNERRGRK